MEEKLDKQMIQLNALKRMEEAYKEVQLQKEIEPEDAPVSRDDLENYLKYLGYDKDEIDYALQEPESSISKALFRGSHFINMAYWKTGDAGMKERLGRIHALVVDIYNRVQIRPDLETKARHMTEYYLPSLEKVLRQYWEIAEGGGDGENYEKMYQTVDDMLSSCVSGFTKIREDLYEDDVMTADVEVDVMKKLMKQDGLID